MIINNQSLTIVSTRENIENLRRISNENQIPVAVFLNKQLEKYANKNNIDSEKVDINIDYQLNIKNLSNKAKAAYDHLQKEMFNNLLSD